jgi:hypothetical protein
MSLGSKLSKREEKEEDVNEKDEKPIKGEMEVKRAKINA